MANAANGQAQAAIPFPIASMYSSRFAFSLPTQTLSAVAPTQLTPIELPAVGYTGGVLLTVSINGEGGTAPEFEADGPWNVLQQVQLRNAGGSDIISTVSGYDAFLMNLFGGTTTFGQTADPRFGFGYDATAPSASFKLWVPTMFDPEWALGVLPAMASNANYQLVLSLAAIPTVLSGAPDVTVDISGTYFYFDFPAAVDRNGRAQAQMPDAEIYPFWQKESPPIVPGEQLVKTVNVGNILRNHILITRDSSGARDDTILPNVIELILDNQARFRLSKTEMEFMMARWFGLGGLVKDDTPADNVAGALPNGVYVFPYHALLGSLAGDPANTRAQLLATLNATQLQFKLMNAGANASTLEILTQSLTTENAAAVYRK